MNTRPVNLTPSGPPETRLADPPTELSSALAAALALSGDEQRSALGDVVASAPTFLDAWAAVGDIGRDPVERYSAYRVGYHRGLDQLRQSGWRGSGYVRWTHEANRGFLRSLDGLRRSAEEIGESDEAERCALFLRQLDPNWPPTTD